MSEDQLLAELASEKRWAKYYADRAEALHKALEASTAILRALQHARSIDGESLGRQVAENMRVLERQI